MIRHRTLLITADNSAIVLKGHLVDEYYYDVQVLESHRVQVNSKSC